MQRWTLAAPTLAIILSGSAVALPDAKSKRLQTTQVYSCPLTGKDSKGSKITATNGNYLVHFCCAKCKTAFAKLTKNERGAKIAAALKPAAKETRTSTVKLIAVTPCPMTGETVQGEGGGSGVYGKYELHFCCAGCKQEFDRLSKADQEKKIAEVLHQ